MTADPARSGAPATAPLPPAPAISHPTPPDRHPIEPNPTGGRLALLSLTALGVVFGDIGTSPLYAFKEAFSPEYGVTTSVTDIYGVLSLIVWTLTLIVSIKYIVYIMRADNRGEGGILALLALIQQRLRRGADQHRYKVLVALGLIGAALLYGDGVITPAITVLSAVDGLHVIDPVFGVLIVPLAVIILFILFLFQRRGTTRIGVVFGPIMAIWFACLGAFGALEILKAPRILFAINPWYAFEFFAHHGGRGFFILGAVVLVVTGAEALYADMGHFGRRPIRVAWFALVFPALLLNYFGQGALVLRDPSAAANPFYLLFPQGLLYPMVILATIAAVIASQALISGAFSLTQQAMQLGYSPRMTVLHTSRQEAGQIFVPEVNKALMVGTILLVLFFQSADNLAAAYGIAVTGTMVITTILFYYIARQQLRWRKRSATAFLILFLVIDLSFLFANAIKIESGGWVPIAIAAAIYTLMTTWKAGRQILRNMLVETSLPINLFLEDVKRRKPPRVPGTAVFMTSDIAGAPVVLLHHLKHNKVLHEQVLLLSIITADVPEIPSTERTTIEPLNEGFYRVIARYGFMQTPNVKEVMRSCERAGIKLRPGDTTYYLGRERLLPTGRSPMARWRKSIFVFMSRNARSATEFFSIPPNRVVELGAQIEF
ncbi:MAG TPA: potassium transporter Kup [Gemmatimonadaceae bacterium]|nr:potassium transporter Kup [Gemmatimonadaceae bacterium]